MTAQTQTEVQGSNGGVFNIKPTGTTAQVQPTAKGFQRPEMPTFNSVEEKRQHVKERLACAFRYFPFCYPSSIFLSDRHPEYLQSMDMTRVIILCIKYWSIFNVNTGVAGHITVRDPGHREHFW